MRRSTRLHGRQFTIGIARHLTEKAVVGSWSRERTLSNYADIFDQHNPKLVIFMFILTMCRIE
ncbi:hypothetical protein NQ318_011972 [Aromia moschata]|uniref:Uncharacterized protein n=1 Tax=Aromia moschata TaxID=1265417 RepID=A0AAV8XZ57_9CUCU|nr:hypothetical protein NQ318_011972 [Aromia moschata]